MLCLLGSISPMGTWCFGEPDTAPQLASPLNASLPLLPIQSGRHPTTLSHPVLSKERSRPASFWWCFHFGLGVRLHLGRELGGTGLGQGDKAPHPCFLLVGADLLRRRSADHRSSLPRSPAVMHMCFVHKYIILCSCQPRLIGLMFPEEQPKATLAADV